MNSFDSNVQIVNNNQLIAHFQYDNTIKLKNHNNQKIK